MYRNRMSAQVRFNVIVFLGLLLWALVIDDTFGTHLRILLEEESIRYVLRRLPVPPAVVTGALVAGVLAFVSLLVVCNRFLSRHRNDARGRSTATIAGATMLLVALAMAWLFVHPVFQGASGAWAVVVGASLASFTFVPSRRVLVVSHVLIVAASVIVVAAPMLVPAHRSKVEVLHRGMQTEMSRLERLRENVAMINPYLTLDRAAARADTHMVYRFDEHVQDITKLEAPKHDYESGVLLDVPARGKIISVDATPLASTITDGKQIFPEYRAGSVLKTSDPLSVDMSGVGALRIRMSVSAGNSFQVFWGDSIDADRHLRIPLARGGAFASYEVTEISESSGPLANVWIIPSDEDARVEIESILILDRTSALLRGAPWRAGYERINDELRRVLYVLVPSQLTYAVTVPSQRPRLVFGTATTVDEPSTFEVAIGRSGRERTVFSKTITGPPRWHDHEIDLKAFAGETVEVTFRSSSDAGGVAIWSNPVLLGAPMDAPNVVIFLVDCLRADRLGAYGYERNTSPVFDSLATTGTLFEQAYSNGTTTKHSIPSLVSSCPISATGVRNSADVLAGEFPTLPEILRAMGYATAALTTNNNVGTFSGTHQGFSELHTREQFDRGGQSGDDAEALIGDLLEQWLQRNAGRNFLLYVHTMDAHGVYDPPEPYRHFYDPDAAGTPVPRDKALDPEWVKTPTRESRSDLYDGEIAYGDFHFGRFLRMLEDAGVKDNTVLVFMADHGEYFGEHDLWGHNPPPFAQGTHIPLLFVGPGFPAGARVEETVQIMDVMPTLLDAVGMAPDTLLFQGRTLVPLARGEDTTPLSNRSVFVEGFRRGELSFHLGRYHIMPQFSAVLDHARYPTGGRFFNEFIFDFRLKALARRLTRTYRTTYDAVHEMMASESDVPVDVDPATLKQLRALGYID